ncbi:hypothetical protein BKA70DRAFT_1162539 [Coprinopsis sp. MPI-PUGE-AT-0042]|nr:hypothetical protein BKA70DRAFT_1162539 [Coprinopsis sp. MPI-PUGE-AT-0042]
MAKIEADTGQQFSVDGNQAEKGPSPHSPDDIENPNEPEGKDEFRRNAKSWAIYLEEAGEHAKEQAEVWKTGLESLLLFAGLFASVITSFLVESSKKLQLEDQEALLMDIRSVLLNEPIADHEYAPTASQLWVNGLWYSSLLVTLFSAIIGVLARSWIVNYLPLASRQEAGDAYRRWMLDRMSERWKMQKIIRGIPLLVQVAFFLFSLGLGIQAYESNKSIGIAVLSLVAACAMIYAVVTALPLILPSDPCPFKTPLSDVLLDLWTVFKRVFPNTIAPLSGFAPRDLSDTLARVLYEGLIKSPKVDNVDEAIFELNRRPLQTAQLRFFATSDTPRICIQRLQECMSPRMDDPSRRGEIIGAHLQALSQIISTWEDCGPQDELGLDINRAVGWGSPLYRWDFFPESLRGLAFSVRVPLYLVSDLDFDNTNGGSMFGEQWAIITRHVQPHYRLKLVSAACRGVVQGKQTLQRVSGFALVYLLAQNYGPAKYTQWAISRHSEQPSILAISRQYLNKLLVTIGAMCFPTPYLELPSCVSTAKEPSKAYAAYPSPHLAEALVSEDPTTRTHAVAALVCLAEKGLHDPTIIESMLSGLFDTMFREKDSIPVLLPSVLALCRTRYADVMAKMLSQCLHADLSSPINEENEEPCRSWAIIAELVKQVALPEPKVEEVLRSIVPRVVTMGLTHLFPSSIERWALLESLVSLYERSEVIRNECKDTLAKQLSNVFALDSQDDGTNQGAACETLSLHERLEPVAALLLIEYVADHGFGCRLVDNNTLQGALGPHTTTIANLALHGTTSEQRSGAVTILLALAEASPRNEAYERAQSVFQVASTDGTVDVGSLIDLLRCFMRQVDAPPFNEVVPYAKGFTLKYPSTKKLPAVIEKLLPLMFKPSWKDLVVPFFTQLAHDDRYRDGVVASLPKPMAEFFEGCNDMVALVTLLETLVAKGWLEGLSLLMDIAIHNTSPNDQDAASRALATLCEGPDIQTKLLAEIEIKLQDTEWDMGLLTIGGQSSAALGWRKLFIMLSRNIGMRALCAIMLTRIEDMRSPGKLVLDVAKLDMEAARPCYTTDIAAQAYVGHTHPQLRRAAAELLGHVAIESRAGDLISKLLELALTDADDKIRLFCMEHLALLASDVEASPLFVEWMVPSNYGRAECVTDARWRLQLCRLYEALYIPGPLLRLSVEVEDQDVREAAMTSLGRVVAETREYLEVLIDYLKRCLDMATSDSNSNVRAAWASMITSLSFKEPNWRDGPQTLIHLALEDDNRKVRLAAYHGLDTLILKSKWHDNLALSLAKAFETCLKKSSYKPVLEDCHPGYPYAVPFNIVACFIPPLVSYVVERADDNPNVTREEGALMRIAEEGELGHQAALLTNLVENLASRIPGTRCGEFARKLATRIHSRQHPLYPKIPYRPLVQRLVHASREARSTSLALLAIFYWDCAIAADALPLLHPLINIILDDSDTALSFHAARLLHNLCRNETSATQLLSLEPDYVPRLMALLRRENPLSLAVARLIAAISYHTGDINGQILRWIAAELTSERFVEAELGIFQLLSELIASRYLNSKVTADYILLLIASALASRGSPTSDKFRPQLQAYMWLYYRDQIPATDSEVMAELVKIFHFTAFGNHGTEAEADAWLSMAKYLGGPTQP